ncbi:MAG TPA: MFS transporter [Pseudomonadaceae bacterium]|nr:MFS transporter [Pseudomonadaceae bacterium]
MHSNHEEPGYPQPAYAWYVVVILFLAFTVSYIDRQIISLLVDPIKEDLGISDTQIGLLQGFAFTVFYTFAGIPLGRLADRKNRKWIISIGMFMWSIMTAMCGLASTYVHLFLARIGVGVGEASLSPAANSMITDYFPKEKRGKPVAIYFMGVYVGVGLSFILGGLVIGMVSNAGEVVLPLVGELSAWQLTFILVSIPGLLLVAIMPTVKEPYRHGRIALDGKEVDGSVAATKDFFLKHFKAYAVIFLGFGLAGSMAIGFFAWTTPLFGRIHGWETSHIGYTFGTIVMVMGTIGIVLGGAIADRLLQKGQQHAYIRVAIWSILGGMVFSGTAAMVPNPWLAWALLCPAVACFGMPVALAPAAVNLITPNQFRGQAIAIYIFVVGLINNNLGPISVGFLNDYVYRDALAIDRSLLTIAIVFGMLSALILQRSVRYYKHSFAEIMAAAGNTGSRTG